MATDTTDGAAAIWPVAGCVGVATATPAVTSTIGGDALATGFDSDPSTPFGVCCRGVAAIGPGHAGDDATSGTADGTVGEITVTGLESPGIGTAGIGLSSVAILGTGSGKWAIASGIAFLSGRAGASAAIGAAGTSGGGANKFAGGVWSAKTGAGLG